MIIKNWLRSITLVVCVLIILAIQNLVVPSVVSSKSKLIAQRYNSPDFTAPDLQGNQVQLSTLTGRVVPLMFWTIW